MKKSLNNDTVDMTLDLKHETKPQSEELGAFLVHDGDSKHGYVWIPKSLVQREGNVFTMPRWLAEKHGLV